MTKPDAGYGFELCAANDPKRTHCYLGEVKQWIIGRYALATHHRKPIELPAVLKDEWEIVPESELDTTPDDQAWMFLDGKRFRPLYNGWIRKTAREWRNHKCDSLNTPAFIRRKSQPVSAVESGAEFGRWVSVKERLPESSFEVYAIKFGTRIDLPFAATYCGGKWICPYPGSNEEVINVTAWFPVPLRDLVPQIPLPNPPAPEKTDAEKAWEEYSNGESCDGAADIKDAFLAGYAKGAAK